MHKVTVLQTVVAPWTCPAVGVGFGAGSAAGGGAAAKTFALHVPFAVLPSASVILTVAVFSPVVEKVFETDFEVPEISPDHE